jgi:hypothetical protein
MRTIDRKPRSEEQIARAMYPHLVKDAAQHVARRTAQQQQLALEKFLKEAEQRRSK